MIDNIPVKNWWRFKAGKHHLFNGQKTLRGARKTMCGLPINESAVSVPNAVTWAQMAERATTHPITNHCKHCLKKA